MKILKFGGTSVGSPSAIEHVINIVQKNLALDKKIIVVCSAMVEVTNKLLQAGELAATSNTNYTEIIQEIETKHIETIKKFINPHDQSKVIARIKCLITQLEDLLQGIFLLHDFSLRSQDLILSFGEQLSCYIISEIMQNANITAKFVDSRDLIKTDSNFGNARVNFELTNKNLAQFIQQLNYVPIITGFIASTIDNETTTLGRGGSDYTASIIGAGVHAEIIEIWTDVDGVMTADPRYVKNAFTIPNISYQEAMELSHFGAKIIYSPTLYPAFINNIPIQVKNTFNSTHPGTLVSEKSELSESLGKGISSINKVSMLTLRGAGMIGVPGFLGKVFTTIAQKNVNVILVTQASSENSICIVVDSKDGLTIENTINQEFANEINWGKMDKVVAKFNLSVVSIIGQGMRKASGILGKIFAALGKNGINIIAIAQGSSELNISLVVDNFELNKSLNVIHEALFDADLKTLNLFMVGVGRIGSTLLKQIQETSKYLLKEKNLKINIIGLANSKKMLIHHTEINLSSWQDKLANAATSVDMSKFVIKMQQLNLPNTVFIDCTSNKNITSYYEEILSANISIVTPNKLANSSNYAEYKNLEQLATKNKVKFMYETNVGAGLPVINTLKNLKFSGDRILKIEGVLSGTLSYIFNNFKGDKTFSQTVEEAKHNGYTEPDPRDDLNGTDVARKILILARETGSKMELSDVKLANILPEVCRNAKTIPDFFAELEKNNHIFEEQKKLAEQKNNVLRFIAKYENGEASVGLEMVDSTHPFYFLSGSDNIIAFTTERYKERPLVIQGPGAGAEVTASGIFAEVIAISSYLSK